MDLESVFRGVVLLGLIGALLGLFGLAAFDVIMMMRATAKRAPSCLCQYLNPQNNHHFSTCEIMGPQVIYQR